MSSAWVPINGFLARLLVPVFIRGAVPANAVTALSGFSGLLSSAAFLKGKEPFFVLGALGFLAANVLDECDGEVARRTGTASGFGSWLDVVTDSLVHMGFFLSLGWGLAMYTAERHWALLGGLAAAAVLMATVLSVRREVVLRGREALSHPDPPKEQQYHRGGWADLLRGWFRIDFSVVVMVSVLLGWMGWILWASLFGAIFFWIPMDLWIARMGVVRK